MKKITSESINKYSQNVMRNATLKFSENNQIINIVYGHKI